MKIAICGSLNFAYEMKKIQDDLTKFGHQVHIPLSAEKIIKGTFNLEKIKKEKEDGNFHERAIKYDAIREYWKIIQKSDAILVANFDKHGVTNYIGGNTFLEMGFAHVLNKKIFLLNPIPKMIYIDEIRAMKPIVIDSDLEKIK